MRTKGMQIGNNENKIINFADNTTIFFKRYYNCLIAIQVILKLFEDAYRLTINLSKAKSYGKLYPGKPHLGQISESMIKKFITETE